MGVDVALGPARGIPVEPVQGPHRPAPWALGPTGIPQAGGIGTEQGEKLDGIREGNGTLLDQSMIVYGSAIADGNRHSHVNLPVILAQGPPSADPKAPQKPGARADLNARIAKVAEGRKNVTLVDLFTPVATPDGKPIPEYFAADMVHISPAGYQKWLETLVPVFNKLGLKGTPQP